MRDIVHSSVAVDPLRTLLGGVMPHSRESTGLKDGESQKENQKLIHAYEILPQTMDVN